MKKKQQESDYRNRRYQELKDKILYEKELKDKADEVERKKQLRDFLKKQADEKKQREEDIERELREQGQIWKSQNDQFSSYLDGKKQQKLDNLARYREDLQIQMEDKIRREKEMAALRNFLNYLEITSNEVKMNQLFLNKVRQMEVEEEQLKKEIQDMTITKEAIPSS